MDDATKYAMSLYNNLCVSCPIKTSNMLRGIKITETPDSYIITISDTADYAESVNYNWGKRDAKSRADYSRRGLHKERDNYKWVERTIHSTAKTVFGKGSTTHEL